MLQNILVQISTLLEGKPRISIALFLAFFVIGGATSFRLLEFNDGDPAYLPAGDPVLETEKRLKQHFPGDVSIVAILEPKDLLNPNFLERLDQAAVELKSSATFSDVIAVTQQDHIETTTDGFAVAPLIDPDRVSDHPRDYWLSRIQSDPFGKGTMVGKEFQNTLLIATPTLSERAEDQIAAEKEFFEVLEKHSLNSELKGVSGVLNSYTARYSIVESDNLVFVPLVMLGGFIAIYLLFGNWIYVLLTGCTIVVTLVFTTTFYALMGWPFTAVSSILGPLMSAIISALFLHFYNEVKLTTDKRKNSYKDAVRDALEYLCVPSFYIVITTSAGMFSLVFTEIPTVRHFGIVGAVGVLAAFFFILLLVPAPLAAWGQKGQGKTFSLLNRFDRFLSFWTTLSVRHPVAALTGAGVLTVCALYYTTHIKVETSLIEFFDSEHDVTKGLQMMEKDFHGISSFYMFLESEKLDRFKDPELLSKIEKIENWLAAQPGVDRTISVNDFVKQMNMAFHQGKNEYKAIPDSQELLSQYLFIYGGQDIFDFVDRDFKRGQLSVYTRLYGANEAGVLLDRMDAFMKTIDWPADVKWSMSGYMKSLSEQEDYLVTDQQSSFWSAVALIFIFLFAHTRSVKGATVCLIPNIGAPLFMFGAMGLFSIWLNIGTVLVASIVIGIAVDDTIHIFHSFQHRVSKGARTSWAILRAFRGTGRATVATTIVLSIEFGLLMLSEFSPTSEFGTLGLSGIIAALLLELTVMPALLVLLYSRNKTVQKQNSDNENEFKKKLAKKHHEKLDSDNDHDQKKWAMAK